MKLIPMLTLLFGLTVGSYTTAQDFTLTKIKNHFASDTEKTSDELVYEINKNKQTFFGKHTDEIWNVMEYDGRYLTLWSKDALNTSMYTNLFKIVKENELSHQVFNRNQKQPWQPRRVQFDLRKNLAPKGEIDWDNLSICYVIDRKDTYGEDITEIWVDTKHPYSDKILEQVLEVDDTPKTEFTNLPDMLEFITSLEEKKYPSSVIAREIAPYKSYVIANVGRFFAEPKDHFSRGSKMALVLELPKRNITQEKYKRLSKITKMAEFEFSGWEHYYYDHNKLGADVVYYDETMTFTIKDAQDEVAIFVIDMDNTRYNSMILNMEHPRADEYFDMFIMHYEL